MAENQIITTGIETQLIKTTTANIGGEAVNSVDARELHSFLEIRENFNEWIKRYLTEYDFVINSDFCRSLCIASNSRKMESYMLTIDMAKELSMISRTKKGKQARKYFIQCEKALRQVKSTSPSALLKEELTIFELLEVPKHLAQIESVKHVEKISGVDLSYALLSAPAQNDIKKEEIMLEPTEMGKRFGISAVKMNQKLMRLGLQINDGTGWIPTAMGKKISTRHAWKKGKKSGYNLKWNINAINKMAVEKK